MNNQDVADAYHRLYYDSRAWMDISWLGTPVQKLPLDLWIYQEILHGRRPDVVVETGTMHGGSALFLASICQLLDHGRVITIDLTTDPSRPRHPRISYLEGRSSVDPALLRDLRRTLRPDDRVMVILDSDHSRDHVLAELRAYAPLVTPGQYLIVEDTNVNGHPVLPDFGPGPMEALPEFLAQQDDFAVDDRCERLFVTFNPRGFLVRKEAVPSG
jgi:cephalosporin hydroxylase